MYTKIYRKKQNCAFARGMNSHLSKSYAFTALLLAK